MDCRRDITQTSRIEEAQSDLGSSQDMLEHAKVNTNKETAKRTRVNTGKHEGSGAVVRGDGMAEVAAVAVGTGVSGQDHAAELGLVARVADDWAQFPDSMCETAKSRKDEPNKEIPNMNNKLIP
ncbi:hypothetical protein MA16_Dca004896 [Dendrobium catenatum]|uniref:Uncharacterized protein n=1 Tax=Dendrobium catenatum TaxID=906689 RepID=A0A2I0WGB7_9ASPA|nr:hypothetical protein MA16_Dca004896 [Dendrobium catenatum]